MIWNKWAFRAGIVSVLSMPLGAVIAQPLLQAPPRGEVVLTITGEIKESNLGDVALFDLEMLMQLDAVSFSTETPWTDGLHTYTGVPLMAVLEQVGVRSGRIKAKAVNLYEVEMNLEEFSDTVPIIAYLVDGSAMSVREKGPLWIIFPYDDDPAYQLEHVYSQSVWQLTEIEVLAE